MVRLPEHHPNNHYNQSSLTPIEPSKALGPNNLTPIHIENLSYYSSSVITKLFINIVNSNIMPISWKTTKNIPILKPNKDPYEHNALINMASNLELS